MSLTLFLTLLVAFATVTSLVTQAVKMVLDGSKVVYSSNIVALITGLVVGIIGTAIVYQLMGISFTVNNIICIFLMGVADSLGAMIGYDKVIQAIKQFGSK
jgi:flagellar biosynthesis protein FliQ